MDFFCWDYSNLVPSMSRTVPNSSEVTEVDIYGRRQTGACFNHPDYRAQLRGKIESCLSGYAGMVDGIAWGCERTGPLQNAIGGTSALEASPTSASSARQRRGNRESPSNARGGVTCN